MEDDNDGFKFSKGFVFEDSDDEKQAPAQPAWAFPDSKREMERGAQGCRRDLGGR